MENHKMFPKVRSGFLHLSISFKVGELTCNNDVNENGKKAIG